MCDNINMECNSVSTTTRMAGNLWVADARTADGKRGEEGEVVLIEDATAAVGAIFLCSSCSWEQP